MLQTAEREPHGARHRRYAYAVMFIALAVFALIYVATKYFGIAPKSSLQEAALSAVIGMVGIELFGFIIFYALRSAIRENEAGTLRNLFRVIGYTSLIIFLFSLLSINVTGLLLTTGFLGIVLGLAAQSTLSNFISGIYLLSSKAFEPGDRVVIHTWQYTMQPQSYPHDKFVPGFSGRIKNIGLLYTELTNDEGVPVYMPNSIASGALILNYGRAKEDRVSLLFDMPVSMPFQKVKKHIAAVLKAKKIDDYTITMEYLHKDIYVVTVNMLCEFKDRRQLRSEIYQRIVRDMQKKA